MGRKDIWTESRRPPRRVERHSGSRIEGNRVLGESMKDHRTHMQSGCRLTLGIILALLSGCAYYDGGFVYHVEGRAIDAHESPLPRCRVGVRLRPFTATSSEDERAFSRTDDEGRFSRECTTRLSWGYMKLFNLIPLGSTKGPAPPPLKNLYLAVEVSPGRWQYAGLELTKEQQPKAAHAERWISLGDIRMPER